LDECFVDEHTLEERMKNIKLLDSKGETSDEGLEYLHLQKTMYECRRKLIQKYVREFRYGGQLYCENLFELPIPPMLFFPGGRGINDLTVGVSEREFKSRREEYYVIRGQEGPLGDSLVIAGLKAVPGSQPSIAFEEADWCLANRYFYERLFEKRHVLYSELIDEVYEKIFAEYFIKAPDER
jgi:hypothetical protein